MQIRSMIKLNRMAAFGFLITVILLGILYFRQIAADQLIDFDDPSVVGPMKQITSLHQYMNARSSEKIMDVQPVRDLSYFLNFRMQEAFGWGGFYLTNFLIWIGIGICVFLILRDLECSENFATVFTCLYLLDPIFASSISWISARKHLLASFFILMATRLLIARFKSPTNKLSAKDSITIIGLYFLACFSQPLIILWPVFAFIYLLFKRGGAILKTKSILLTGICLSAIGLLCAYLNHVYYTQTYSKFATKYVDSNFDTFTWKLRALGRYTFQTLLPIQPNIWDHDPGSPYGVIGIALLILLLVFFSKFHRDKLIWLSLFGLTLLPVLIRMTNVFAADNYLVVASLGLLIPIALALNETKNSRRETFESRVVAIGGVIALCFVLITLPFAQAWTSTDLLWTTAYESEPTAKNTAHFAAVLLKRGDAHEARLLVEQAYAQAPHLMNIGYTLAASIYQDNSLSLPEKMNKLETTPGAWPAYHLAALLAAENKFAEASKKLISVLPDRDFNLMLETILADATFFCAKATTKDCASKLPSLIEESRKRLIERDWNENAFQERKKSLGLSNKN